MIGATQLETWARQVAAASPERNPEQQRIAVTTYRLLARGEPVAPTRIAEAAGVTAERVEETLRPLPLVLWDDLGRVVGFYGIHVGHLVPTHIMEVAGTTVFGWCAWDTLFITEILGEETHVASTDPQNGARIELTVTPDGVTDLQPPEAVVSLLLPEGGLGEDAIQRFCHRIYFFTTPESARQWISDRPGMFAVTVDEAFQLGQLTNQMRFGAALDGTRPSGATR